MLAVSGRLNSQRGGPGVFPDMPKEALEGNSDPASVWKSSPEAEADRRTIYVFVKRSLLVPLVEVLDLCDTTRSTARRNVTTVAPQALTLYNGAFANRMARALADRLEKECGDEAGRQIERFGWHSTAGLLIQVGQLIDPHAAIAAIDSTPLELDERFRRPMQKLQRDRGLTPRF